MRVLVNGELLGEITTNQNLTVEEAIDLIGAEAVEDENEGDHYKVDDTEFWYEDVTLDSVADKTMERVIEKSQKGMLAALEGKKEIKIVKKANPEYIEKLIAEANEGFVDLEGSEKQIAWAADIRKSIIAEIESEIRRNENTFASTGEEILPADWNEFLGWFKSQNSAKMYIDGRNILSLYIMIERFHKT